MSGAPGTAGGSASYPTGGGAASSTGTQPNGAAPSTAPSTGAPDPSQPGSWEQFRDSIRQLGTDLGGRLDGIRQTVQSGEEATRAAREAAAAEARAAAQAAQAPPDFEAMSRSELVNHMTSSIMSQVTSAITEALKPVTDRLTVVQTSTAQDQGQRQVADMQMKHKDFIDWKEEMVRIVQGHPTLNLAQAYALARAENPTKAKELDLHYDPPAPPPKPMWSGLTGALNGDGGDGSPKKVDNHTATVEAYREVADRFPGVLPALLNM